MRFFFCFWVCFTQILFLGTCNCLFYTETDAKIESHDNFTFTGASGSSLYYNCSGVTYLGGWNKTGRGSTIQRAFSDLPLHNQIQVSFDFIFGNEWADGDAGYLSADGFEVWAQSGVSTQSNYNTSLDCGEFTLAQYPGDYDIAEYTPSPSFTFSHTASTLTLIWSSSSSLAAIYEWFGLRNFVMVVIDNCTAANCDTCQSGSTTVCSTCNSGYYLYNGECSSSCPTVSYYPNSTTWTCNSCNTSCYSCSGSASDQCTACISGNFLYEGSCTTSCPSFGYYQDSTNNTCEACDSTCYTCNSSGATSCTSCLRPLRVYFTSCVSACPAGTYFIATTNNCTVCNSSCHTCSGPSNTSCLTCNSSMFFYNYACYASCPNGTYPHTANTGQTICSVCDKACATCIGSSNTNCTSCSGAYYFLAAEQLCATTCPDPYTAIPKNRTCMITEVDASTLNTTLQAEISSKLPSSNTCSNSMSLADEGTFIEGVTDTVTQFKITNYATSSASCPGCSGNGNCQYNSLYLENLCNCDSGWTGSSCSVPQSDVPYLQDLDMSILNQINSCINEGISLVTTSPSQDYLNSLLEMANSSPITLTEIQYIFSIISTIISNDYNSKNASWNFDVQKMTTAAQIIDACMNYIYSTDCYLQQDSSQKLMTSATTVALSELSSFQLWNKEPSSTSYTIDTNDFQLFAERVYPSDLNGLKIDPPNQPSIALNDANPVSGNTTAPVDVQVLFWKNNLLSCPSVQQQNNTPPLLSIAINQEGTIQESSYASSVSATISYPNTGQQKYSACVTNSCNLTTVSQGGSSYYQCACHNLSDLSTTSETKSVIARSNLYKLLEISALGHFNYLASWAFWLLWGMTFWIAITIICIKFKIIRPLTFRAYNSRGRRDIPKKLDDFRVKGTWLWTIFYGLRYGHSLASIYFFEDALFPRIKRGVLLYVRLQSLMAFSSIFNSTTGQNSFTDTLIMLALPLVTVLPLNMFLKFLLVTKVKSKYMILRRTKGNSDQREIELKKRQRQIKAAKVKVVIGYLIILAATAGCWYAVLVVAANSDSTTSERWAKNFLVSVAQDMGIIARGQSKRTIKLLRLGVDPITTRALAMLATRK